MRRILHSMLSSRLPAIGWTLIIFILLALPGKMLPNEEHLEIPQLDKLVHLILFGVFVFLWSYYFSATKDEKEKLKKRSFSVFIYACIFGIAMEFVQKYFIPNRDFDLFDILADITGALTGFLIFKFLFAERIKR